MSQLAQQLPTASRVSMRHLYLYAHMLLADINKVGRSIRIEWMFIPTAQIGPDPQNPKGLLLGLPKMASQGTEEDARLIDGLISHEIVCHGLNTDFSVTMKPGIEGDLTNIIEDPRGELRGARIYPGSPSVIHETLKILVKRNVFHGPKGTEQPPEILASWLVCELRSELLKQSCLAAFAVQYRRMAVDVFGQSLVNDIKAIALEGCYSGHTQGAADASAKIVQLLKLNSTSNQTQTQTQTSDNAAGDEKSNETNQQAIKQVLDSKSSELGPFGQGLEEVICNSSSVFKRGAGGYSGTSTDEMLELTQTKTGGSLENRAALRAGAQRVASSLSLGFSELVEAHAKVRRRTGDVGALNGNLLWRVPFGDMQVFTELTRAEALNTSFYLLVDESSSMDLKFGPAIGTDRKGDPIFDKAKEAASKVGVAVGEVLTEAEIPFGMASYNTSVREWHSFGEDWAATLQRYVPAATGNTNTHLAVAWALKKLIYRQEERKILIVVTDGDPGNISVLESALSESANLGIEVRFVLIGARHVAQFAELSAPYGVALNANELAASVFKALKSAIPQQM